MARWRGVLIPGHPDKTASLSLNEADDGKVLMHCHAGCTPETIVEALGLKIADLFPDKEPPLKSVKVVATYDYRDAEGRLVYQVVRYEPKKFKERRLAGRGGSIWDLKGVTPLLYKLPELLSADPDEWVCISEGEKDVDNLNRLDFVAACNSGGALKFPPRATPSISKTDESQSFPTMMIQVALMREWLPECSADRARGSDNRAARRGTYQGRCIEPDRCRMDAQEDREADRAGTEV